MEKFLIQETPGKVLGFTGAALFSMALLFSVSASNASFGGVEHSLPDPFAPQKVVSAIDSAAAGYSQALLSFLEPARGAVALHLEQINWVAGQAFQPLAQFSDLENAPSPQIAGAFILTEAKFIAEDAYESSEALSIDTIYSILVGE